MPYKIVTGLVLLLLYSSVNIYAQSTDSVNNKALHLQSGILSGIQQGQAYDQLFKLGDEENAMAATAAHEGSHASEYDNINAKARNPHLEQRNNTETIPERNELSYLQQAAYRDIFSIVINIFGVQN